MLTLVSVIILKNPRSGSSWFLQLVNSSPNVFVTEEILTSKRRNPEAYLARALREPMSKRGPAFEHPARAMRWKQPAKWEVLGFSVSPKWTRGIDLLAFGAKMVLYERTNKVKQALAAYRGRMLKRKCGYNNIRGDCRLPASLVVNITQLKRHVVETMAKDVETRALVSDDFYTVTYEALLSDPVLVLDRLFAWLGVERRGQLSHMYSKSTGDDLRRVILNFLEVKAWLERDAPCLTTHLLETRPGVTQNDTCVGVFATDVETRRTKSGSWTRASRRSRKLESKRR